jgi:hypothetical protein
MRKKCPYKIDPMPELPDSYTETKRMTIDEIAKEYGSEYANQARNMLEQQKHRSHMSDMFRLPFVLGTKHPKIKDFSDIAAEGLNEMFDEIFGNNKKQNMKKYKLLKWYPSLPKDWIGGMIVEQGDEGVHHMYYRISYSDKKYTDQAICPKQVENNPEYWAEYKFTSLDEVDIFHGDVYWQISRDDNNKVTGACATSPACIYANPKIDVPKFKNRSEALILSKELSQLAFGGHEVGLDKDENGINISCNGITGTFKQLNAMYQLVKRDAAPRPKLQFGDVEDTVVEFEYASDGEFQFDTIEVDLTDDIEVKIGCTIGTWGELKNIINKCIDLI